METIAEEIRSDTADTVDEKMDTDEKQTNCYWCVRMDGWMNLTSSFVADHFFTLLFIWFDFSGKDRNLNILELLCATCSRWFHESCIGFQLGKMVPFATNYTFFCKNCSPTGLESFRKSLACKLAAEFHSSRCANCSRCSHFTDVRYGHRQFAASIAEKGKNEIFIQ